MVGLGYDRLATEEGGQPLSQVALSQVEGLEIKPGRIEAVLAHYRTGLPLRLNGLARLQRGDGCQFHHLVGDRVFGKADMAVVAEFAQGVEQGGAGPLGGIRGDTELAGQLISCMKPDTPDISRQAVGVGANESDGLVAISAVDAHGAGAAHAV